MARRPNLSHGLIFKIKIYHKTTTTTFIGLPTAYVYFGSTTAKLSNYDKDHMAQEPKYYLLSCPLQKVCQPTSDGIVMSLQHKILTLTHASFSPGGSK